MMNRTGYILTLFLLAFVLSPVAKAGKVYRWTDADGGIHYGQHKPSGTDSQRVTIRYKSETRAEAEAKLKQLTQEAGLGAEGVVKDEQKLQSADAQKKADAERKQECVVAAHNLQKLGNRAKHILVSDESGTPVTMDSVQREAAMDRIRKWMSENNCR